MFMHNMNLRTYIRVTYILVMIFDRGHQYIDLFFMYPYYKL